MGCAHSRRIPFILNDNIQGQDKIAKQAFEKLSLNKYALDTLYTAFCSIDIDGSGSIKYDEFMSYFRIENTAFNKQIFSLFDSDNSGLLNFLEFVCAMWNFLATDPKLISHFAFHIVSFNSTDTMGNNELMKLLTLIHGTNYLSIAGLKEIIEKMIQKYGRITIDEFNEQCRIHPVLVSPVLKLQLKLRDDIIGHQFWVDFTKMKELSPIMNKPSYINEVMQQAQESYIIYNRQSEFEAKRKKIDDDVTRKNLSKVLAAVRFKSNIPTIPHGNIRQQSKFNIDKYLTVNVESSKTNADNLKKHNSKYGDLNSDEHEKNYEIDLMMDLKDSKEKRDFLSVHELHYTTAIDSDVQTLGGSTSTWHSAKPLTLSIDTGSTPPHSNSRNSSPRQSPKNHNNNNSFLQPIDTMTNNNHHHHQPSSPKSGGSPRNSNSPRISSPQCSQSNLLSQSNSPRQSKEPTSSSPKVAKHLLNNNKISPHRIHNDHEMPVRPVSPMLKNNHLDNKNNNNSPRFLNERPITPNSENTELYSPNRRAVSPKR